MKMDRRKKRPQDEIRNQLEDNAGEAQNLMKYFVILSHSLKYSSDSGLNL